MLDFELLNFYYSLHIVCLFLYMMDMLYCSNGQSRNCLLHLFLLFFLPHIINFDLFYLKLLHKYYYLCILVVFVNLNLNFHLNLDLINFYYFEDLYYCYQLMIVQLFQQNDNYHNHCFYNCIIIIFTE